MMRNYRLAALGLGTMLLMAGCAGGKATAETTLAETTVAETAAETLAQVEIMDEAVPLYSKPSGAKALVPTASGATVYQNGKVTLDASNASQGYVMVKYTGSKAKIKVQVTKSGKETYTYNLNSDNVYEVFPLSEGSGTYSIKVFENISGNQYSQSMSQDINVSLTNDFLPFLYPNQYVNFSAGSAAVQKGVEVAASATDQLTVVTNIYNYVVQNFTYDTAKANSVASGYLPNVDQVLAQKTGICFDYAAVMAAMLRTQDIPTKLVVGYTGSVYHAWINVYLDNMGWVDNIIYFDGQNWKLMDPTFASSGKESQEIMDYINNPGNYQAKYAY